MKKIKYVLPAVLTASLLSSCAKTPGNILDSSTGSPGSACSAGSAGTGGTPESAASQTAGLGSAARQPVSEATTNAVDEIKALSGINGIFRFDGCDILIPAKERFGVYDARREGLDTPRGVYDMFRYLEGALLYEGAIADEDIECRVPGYSGAGAPPTVSVGEFLAQDDPDHQLVFFDPSGLGILEHDRFDAQQFFSAEWLGFPKGDVTDTVKPLTDGERLTESVELKGGEHTYGECAGIAESFLNSLPLYKDSKVEFRVTSMRLFGESGAHMLSVEATGMLDGVPLTGLSYDPTSGELPFGLAQVHGGGAAGCDLLSADKFDRLWLLGTHKAYDRRPSDSDITEMIPVSAVFEELKSTLAAQTVYDVKQITLGYALVSYDGEPGGDAAGETMLVWNIALETINKAIDITADALTGKLSIYAHDKDA